MARASQPSWGRIQRVPTYELVLDQIEEQLVSGAFGPGDRLPPERELASMIGASRQAVREAMRVLQAQGVVRSQQGTGSNSGTMIVPAPAKALSRLLKLHLALASFPPDDLTEARVTLERASAASAANRRTDADLVRIRALLRDMEPDLGREEFNPLDTAFHVTIAASGGNRLVSELTAAIRESMRGALLVGMRSEPDWPALRDQLRQEHHGIADAIGAGDAVLAADRTEAHIRAFHRRLS